MIKVSLIANDYEKSKNVTKYLKDELQKNKITIDDNDPNIVISIGGDGTLLRAFHKWKHKIDDIRFIGVHTGHLGFYTDWRDYEILELVESLKHDDNSYISYPLLEMKVVFKNKSEKKYLALNESTIRQVNKTMVTDVMICDKKLECFRGDGLSIATPTGSTGYNKSVGGAVMNPTINTLQMTEIASLNSRVYRTLGAPIIISEDDYIHLHINDDSSHILTVDQNVYTFDDIENIYYKIANKRIKFAKYRHMNFWDRVKEAFIEDETNL